MSDIGEARPERPRRLALEWSPAGYFVVARDADRCAFVEVDAAVAWFNQAHDPRFGAVPAGNC